IYGGLSFPSGGTGAVWYPSNGFNTPRGLLVAAYMVSKPAAQFQARPLDEQAALARAAVERLHPGQGAKLTAPIIVNWNKVPFNHGPWLHWTADGNDPAAYRLLLEPQGRIHLSGAHLSHLPSWQEGAVAAAHRTTALLAEQVRAEGLTRRS
ncbi:MAG: flavin monoamine oxidase family protein, partial [Phenylobacterium sp.]